jgi:hypothetical protein
MTPTEYTTKLFDIETTFWKKQSIQSYVHRSLTQIKTEWKHSGFEQGMRSYMHKL